MFLFVIYNMDVAVIKIISGEYKGHSGAKGKYVDALLLDV